MQPHPHWKTPPTRTHPHHKPTPTPLETYPNPHQEGRSLPLMMKEEVNEDVQLRDE